MAGNFDPKTFSQQPFNQKVEKPWGYEIIFSPPESPAQGKLFFVKANHRWSLQYHDQKIEVVCLIKGKAKYIWENQKGELVEHEMELNKGYYNQPGQTHRVITITDCELVETSTPETGNTVRIEDDYKRSTETEDMRKEENRGWK